ncbi:MAG: hemolysin III family protein [Chthoniobacterales bacterium]
MEIVHEMPASSRWTQSHGEEMANSASHGLGVLAAAVGAPFLVKEAVERGNTAFLVGSIIFLATMLFQYLGSAVYHWWPRTPFKGALQTIDHSAIFLLIAGTYTPFTLGPLRGPWGWTVLVLIWSCALCGVLLKVWKGALHRPRLAIGLYLAMGWLILLVIWPLARAIPWPSLVWLVGGGVVYTAGVIFLVNDRKRYHHFVWHLFVLGGTCCHYFAVLSYAA